MARFGIIALASALVAANATAAEPPDEPRQAELLHLLKHDCGSCHGMTMKGGLGPALLPHDLEGVPADQLALIILDGVPGTPMPPWRPLISESDARWLARTLKSGDAR